MATSTSKVTSKAPPKRIAKAVPVSVTNPQIIGTNSVQCVLGKEEFLRPIFSYYRMPESWQADGDKTLREGIEHAFMFTMLRDQFYGGWAHCWKDAADGLYHLKLTSPRASDDVRGYAELIPAFVKIFAQAQKLVATALKKAPAEQQTALSFLPPFGLSMLNARGVMLLHYPPDEPIVYLNYLHARTIKRWDSLLICNDYRGFENPLLEAIVDVYPVAADGGSSGGAMVDQLCEPLGDLAKFAYDLLTLLLRPKSATAAKVTQPMVALGGAVREWLFKNKDLLQQIEEQVGPIKKPGDLKPLTQFQLRLQKKTDVLTPVLMMDHPCKYYRGYWDKGAASQVKTDLIGARWFIKMSEHPSADPRQVLQDAKAHWNDARQKDQLAGIVQDQFIQFRNCASGTEA